MTPATQSAGYEPGRDEPDFLAVERERVEHALEKIRDEAVAGLPEALGEAVGYALSASGKRLRPILCIIACRAARGVDARDEALYRLSCALEIVHTYSLVHDDLPSMDDDDVRRGRPTVHRAFGDARAILAGAALLPLAMSVLGREGAALGLTTEESARLVVELASAAGAEGMVGGQMLDLAAEQKTIDAAGLEAIHRRKTGALLTCALRIGAVAGRGSQPLLGALTRYGAALGLAFQIADDLLDVEGDPTALGKTAGRDAALHKASYPALHGVEGARLRAAAMVAEAKAAIDGLGLPELEALADYVVERRR